MMYERLLLLEELQKLAMGLTEGNKLLLKQTGETLKCEFVMGGLVRQFVEVRNQTLARALLQKGVGAS